MFLNEIDPGEVFSALSSLDTKKSGDIYGLTPYVLKQGGSELSGKLSVIFNASFANGVFPEQLKLAKITPIHKGNSKTTPGTYRPISLLPIIGKVFEKLMYKRLISYFDMNKTIINSQYGFQKLKSTEHAILHLQSLITSSIESNEYACAILLDLLRHSIQ